MIDNVNDFIGIFSNDSDEIITYFPKSLQLLDLENWFYYRARDLGTFSRKITLTQRFILDSNKEYTLVLNKSIFSHYPIDANVDDTIEEFYILQKFETIDYFIYVLHPIYDDIIINDRWYQIIDNFEFEFESRNDATLEPNILADELSQLMILHEGLPKDSYTLEDFKYKHPLDDTVQFLRVIHILLQM